MNFGSQTWVRAAAMAALVSFGIAFGCHKPPTTRPQRQAAKPAGYIAFVGAGEADPFWPLLKSSASAYARQRNYDVRFRSPEGDSPNDQLQLLLSLKDPEMRGLIVQIMDLAPIRAALDQFFRSGITIITLIQPGPEELSSGHVGFDDERIGRTLADTVAKYLEEVGTIMLLHAGEDHSVYGPRLRAFRKQISRYPRIEVFAEVDGKLDSRQSRTLMRERSQRYPRLSAWVALDDWPIRDGGRIDEVVPPRCRFLTVGGTPHQWPLLKSGACPAVVAGNYREMGSKAVEFCEAAIRDTSAFPRLYSAPVRIVWATDLDNYVRDWTSWATVSYPVNPEE